MSVMSFPTACESFLETVAADRSVARQRAARPLYGALHPAAALRRETASFSDRVLHEGCDQETGLHCDGWSAPGRVNG